jgi:hypothetical protein
MKKAIDQYSFIWLSTARTRIHARIMQAEADGSIVSWVDNDVANIDHYSDWSPRQSMFNRGRRPMNVYLSALHWCPVCRKFSEDDEHYDPAAFDALEDWGKVNQEAAYRLIETHGSYPPWRMKRCACCKPYYDSHSVGWCARADRRDFKEEYDLKQWINTPSRPAQYVYVISAPGAVKVGRTSVSPLDRLRSLQVGNPNRLVLEYSVKTDDSTSLERMVHSRLEDSAVSGEWFSVDPKIAQRAIQEALIALVESKQYQACRNTPRGIALVPAK